MHILEPINLVQYLWWRDPAGRVNGIIGWTAARAGSVSSEQSYQRVAPIKHLLPSFHQIESSTQSLPPSNIPGRVCRRRSAWLIFFLVLNNAGLVKGPSRFIWDHCWHLSSLRRCEVLVLPPAVRNSWPLLASLRAPLLRVVHSLIGLKKMF